MKTFVSILAILLAINFAHAKPERYWYGTHGRPDQYFYGAHGKDADMVRDGLNEQFGNAIVGPNAYYDSSTGNFGFDAWSTLPDSLDRSPKWERTGQNIWESDQGTAVIRFGPNRYIASPNQNGYGK